jgi:hypothetical protein
MWGSEAPLAGPPGPYLRAFMDLEIAEDLRDGYGYPQITRRDKELILGGTFAKLMAWRSLMAVSEERLAEALDALNAACTATAVRWP